MIPNEHHSEKQSSNQAQDMDGNNNTIAITVFEGQIKTNLSYVPHRHTVVRHAIKSQMRCLERRINHRFSYNMQPWLVSTVWCSLWF